MDAAGQEDATALKPIHWVASSKDDLDDLPVEARREFGHALYLAQAGEQHAHAKPLRGFGSAGVLEVVESTRDGTFRAVYTVRYAQVVYVLHVFQKKSKSGSKTPAPDMDRVRDRLQLAEADYAARFPE